MDTWLFYMFIVSSDWSKVLKHSLPSSPSLLEVSCKAFSEGGSEYCFYVLVQCAFSPFSEYPAWERRNDWQQPGEVLSISLHVQNSFDNHLEKSTLVHC